MKKKNLNPRKLDLGKKIILNIDQQQAATGGLPQSHTAGRDCSALPNVCSQTYWLAGIFQCNGPIGQTGAQG